MHRSRHDGSAVRVRLATPSGTVASRPWDGHTPSGGDNHPIVSGPTLPAHRDRGGHRELQTTVLLPGSGGHTRPSQRSSDHRATQWKVRSQTSLCLHSFTFPVSSKRDVTSVPRTALRDERKANLSVTSTPRERTMCQDRITASAAGQKHNESQEADPFLPVRLRRSVFFGENVRPSGSRFLPGTLSQQAVGR